MSLLSVKENTIIREALQIVEQQLYSARGEQITSSGDSKRMARLKLALYDHEVFAGFMLDSQHHVIEYREFFTGTIDGCAVYPREIVRACLETNTSAMLFLHNHPSGDIRPSQADQHITQRLVDALGLIDVRVLDHVIVGGSDCYSFMDNNSLPTQRTY